MHIAHVGWIALALSVALCAHVAAESRHTITTSKYWCGVVGGEYDGAQCTAEYKPRKDGGACETFAAMNVDDPDLQAQLSEVQNAPVCLANVVDEAKANTIKLRISLRGYVTAGRDESVNDPTMTQSFVPSQGDATFSTGAAYFLYECVVETCTAK
jgi:hypothetical protein